MPQTEARAADTGAAETGAPGIDTDVVRVAVDGREVLLVGTAHISKESVEIVRAVIERERPDAVCVELDERRFAALSERKKWEASDLREVLRKRQLATLLVNLMLSSYQKRLGVKLGVMPGSELLEATKAADEHGIPVALCDRDVRITLRRAWGKLSFFRKAQLLGSLVTSAGDAPELDEEELRRIRQQDVLTELMDELGKALPEIKQVLIDERDAYLAQKIRETEGNKLVAVVGAGHVKGMKATLESGAAPDMDEITAIPPTSPVWKLFGWAVGAVILGSIAYIAREQGLAAAGQSATFWLLANGIPCAIGALVAGGHPLTVLAGFISAPFTSLTPLIGAGYVTAFAQVYLAPPRVLEFQSVTSHFNDLPSWWRNRLLRVFLVFILSTLGSAVGTWVGAAEIISTLVQ